MRRLIGRAIDGYVRFVNRIGKKASGVVLKPTAFMAIVAVIASSLVFLSLTPIVSALRSVVPTSVVPTSVVPPAGLPTSIVFPPPIAEERLVELSTKAGQESVEIDTWREAGNGSGDLKMRQDGIYTTLGAKLSIIEDSPEPTYERCSQIQTWTTQVAFTALHEGSQLCAQSRGERTAMLKIRTLPSSPASNVQFIFYGRTWQLAK
jgi:hypothetical protein